MEKMKCDNLKRIYTRPEDALEFIYEICDKWKTQKDPIETMKSDLRK